MHFRGQQVPHFKRNCPNCDGHDDPYPLWYIGGLTLEGVQAIIELSGKCFRSLEAAARRLEGDGSFCGLRITVERANFSRSPRILRCEEFRRIKVPAWPYETRRELARIWGIAVRPRLMMEEGGQA